MCVGDSHAIEAAVRRCEPVQSPDGAAEHVQNACRDVRESLRLDACDCGVDKRETNIAGRGHEFLAWSHTSDRAVGDKHLKEQRFGHIHWPSVDLDRGTLMGNRNLLCKEVAFSGPFRCCCCSFATFLFLHITDGLTDVLTHPVLFKLLLKKEIVEHVKT